MSQDLPLMPKATAVWLVDNTTLTFTQIAEFCGLHTLEVNGIADGEVAQGLKGADPIAGDQLDAAEIRRCEADPTTRLRLKKPIGAEGEARRSKGPRYTPLSKRQERPASIAWLVRYHPELTDTQIMKLVGTTKPTIQSIRDRSHWQSQSLTPVDPVAVGLCSQTELDEAVRKAAERKAKEQEGVMSADERMSLLSTDESLAARPEPRIPSRVAGLENFSLVETEDRTDPRGGYGSPDDLFNLPGHSSDEDDEDEQPR
ncbi:MAG: cell cycle transcriptional regulator TrcR [Paracoccaceae bacterium]